MGIKHKNVECFPQARLDGQFLRGHPAHNGVTMWDSKQGRASQYICPIEYKRVN